LVGLKISLPLKSPQTLAKNSQELIFTQRSVETLGYSPVHPKVHTVPGFGYLSKKAFYPKKYHRYTFVTLLTY
jgi:hypothetical protein